jgi:hypothetical protein
MRAPFIAAWIAYIFCGGVGVVMLCIRGWPARRVWVYAVPHALTWLSSMVLFYCMVAIIGVVFSVIVQSTRGVISVGLGAIIARWGFLHLEHHVDRKTFWKRMAAAILMTAAIALYAFS